MLLPGSKSFYPLDGEEQRANHWTLVKDTSSLKSEQNQCMSAKKPSGTVPPSSTSNNQEKWESCEENGPGHSAPRTEYHTGKLSSQISPFSTLSLKCQNLAHRYYVQKALIKYKRKNRILTPTVSNRLQASS